MGYSQSLLDSGAPAPISRGTGSSNPSPSSKNSQRRPRKLRRQPPRSHSLRERRLRPFRGAGLVDGGARSARYADAPDGILGRQHGPAHFAATLTRGFTSNGKPPSNANKKAGRAAPIPGLAQSKSIPAQIANGRARPRNSSICSDFPVIPAAKVSRIAQKRGARASCPHQSKKFRERGGEPQRRRQLRRVCRSTKRCSARPSGASALPSSAGSGRSRAATKRGGDRSPVPWSPPPSFSTPTIFRAASTIRTADAGAPGSPV